VLRDILCHAEKQEEEGKESGLQCILTPP